ncbi:cation efflux protein [Neisseria shayeganii 871]|uniref:Cation efflux protein n=1 Tax=Neisseria shayeganii 871 TaxID=1032488 RepID=G4CGE0_9NEIS|nr:cation transporter [Neisseria shayeganii]EGY53188.1 cation efflux protein [Neisseria shayeganii 871]
MLHRSVFHIAKMDCPSEIQLIRMKLADQRQIADMQFDIAQRELTVIHQGDWLPILTLLETLNLDSRHMHSSRDGITVMSSAADQADQRRILWQVLLINLLFFLMEGIAGWLSHSMGLLADSLDMLADSAVYALALMAVGNTLLHKRRVARTAGLLQAALAVWGLVEVLRRFFGWEGAPAYHIMMAVAFLALLGNALCLYLLHKSQNHEAHMQASMIFTANDVWVNLGVIAAAVLTSVTQSKYPDLLVGALVFVLVANGARRIWQLGK